MGRNPARTSSPGLTREVVVRKALDLLDRDGLDGLSMRRLAAELHVQNPALYWHFKDKQELLDEMAATVLHDAFRTAVEPGPDAPWTEWIWLQGRTFRAAMMSHRDGARLIGSANLMRSDLLQGLDRTVARLVELGFPPMDALYGVLAVSDYTMGATFEEQADPGVSDPVTMKTDERRQAFAPYPTLSKLLEELSKAKRASPASTFENGIQLLIDGLATRCRAPRTQPPGRPRKRPRKA